MSLAVAGVLFGAFHFTRAQGRASWQAKKVHPALKVSPNDSISKPVHHNLANSFFTQNYYDGDGPAIAIETDFALDSPNSFFCWLPCTLEVDAKPEVWDGATARNWLWAYVLVDGKDVQENPVAEVPEDGSIVVGPFDWTFTLKPGPHTVQTFIYSSVGAFDLVGWHNNYRVYFP